MPTDIKVPSSVEGVELFRLTQNRRTTLNSGSRVAVAVVRVEARSTLYPEISERNTAELKGRELCERAWRHAFGHLPWDRTAWTIQHATVQCVVQLIVEPE